MFLAWPEEIYASGTTYAERFRRAAVDEGRRRSLRLDVVQCPSSPEGARAALRAALTQPGAPHALLVHNDAAVAMLPVVLHDLDLNVPRDRSVVSLHSQLGRLYGLPYTAVESQPERVSALAVDALARRLAAGTAVPPVATLVRPELTDRGSVARRTAAR